MCVYVYACIRVCVFACMHVCMYVCICVYILMYCLYVGVDYTYIDINTLAQGIKSFLASQVLFQAVTSQPR